MNPHELQKDENGIMLMPMPDLDSPDLEDFDNLSSISGRYNRMLKTTQSCGEYDRLTLGWFENYPNMKFKHTHLEPVSYSSFYLLLNLFNTR